MKRILVLLFLCLSARFCVHAQKQSDTVYMFCYFTAENPKGLKLAYSTDGYQFKTLNQGQPFMKPLTGKDSLFRDPNIVRGADGLFHMVFTVNWKGRQIGYASSPDLVNWSHQQYIPVMMHEDSARNSWAPEILYDAAKKQYLIYWATSIPGRFPATDSSSEDHYNHRIYYVTTKDFKTFTKAQLLYDKGFSVIDATIVKDGKKYIMFMKDETKFPTPEKNIHIATSTTADGGYSAPSPAITSKDYWAEGPTAIKIKGKWMLYFDVYRSHRYSLLTSTDLVHWSDASAQLSLPRGIRHGTIFPITRAAFNTFFQRYINE